MILIVRRKLSAVALIGGILAGGVAATPASAIDQVACPTQNSSYPMSHGLEVWTTHGNFCYAGTPGGWNVNQGGVYRITADWNHGTFITDLGAIGLGPTGTRANERDFSSTTYVWSVTILNG
ncbi:hypothetical protein ABT095_30660 [Kitasatospora sp. NPDC002227]|uniref:hypothetical protein n=1 Tax=Kitasatospora sp. NPDC002227 TaxID=3154773 RepID=UPI0033307B78